MKPDRDILTGVHVKKDGLKIAYQSFRMTETDFPVLTCAVSRSGEEGPFSTVIGARPQAAALVDDVVLVDPADPEALNVYADEVISRLTYGSNMRGGADYRKGLSKVLIRRCIEELI